MDLTEGVKPHVIVKEPQNKYLVNDFIYCKAGVYDHLEGFEELKASGIIKDFYFFKWHGAIFDGTVKSSGDRIAGYSVIGDSIEELILRHRMVNKRIKVIDDKGNDIMRHDLIPDLENTDIEQ